MTPNSIFLGARFMQRINLAYFYDLGAAMRPLPNLKPDTPLSESWVMLYEAEKQLGFLLESSLLAPAIRSSYETGKKLRTALTNGQDWTKKLTMSEVFSVTGAAKDFQTIVRAELGISDAYFVSRKAAYDTITLIQNAEAMFSPDLPSKVTEAIPEIREAGKCLAYELATASGFHLFRVLELVLRRYWEVIGKGRPQPKQKNLGVYLDHMEKHNLGDRKVRATLKQIKDLHRNTLIHPEDVLQVDDAIGLFGIAQSAINAMLKVIPMPDPTVSLGDFATGLLASPTK